MRNGRKKDIRPRPSIGISYRIIPGKNKLANLRVYLRKFKQMDKYLNIVSFNIPYPANYGGVIDVYYKLEALRACGVKLILHCFEYERPHAPELESICDKVFYYKRRTGVIANLTWLPYNVYSRKDHRLIENLLQNDYPILFAGRRCGKALRRGDAQCSDRLQVDR